LRRNQGDDLMPTIEEGEVIKEFRARNDARMVSKFFGHPSDCDHDKKIHFAVLEDMNAYRDEGMGDVISGEPFLREVGINARRFEGMITIYNGNEEVTYQMDPNMSEMRRWKNGLHPGTSACLSGVKREGKRPRCNEIDEVGEVSII
ncbi:hypothetical protein Tco_1382073, partial [Tanacetum coccineum]